MSAPQPNVARITFADAPEEGRIVMRINFRRPVENDGPHSPAVQAAMEVFRIFAERHAQEVERGQVE